MNKYNSLFNLHLFHQPIVNIDTGCIVGTEALIRLKTSKGYLLPSEFLSNLQESIDNLEYIYWVILEAINHNVFFKKCGFDLNISINITVQELKNPNFILLVKKIFSNGINNNITFEITEDYTKENLQTIPSIIRNLKEIGVNTSIDDFGKELSNFDRLITYPVDTVKLDKMFLKEITCCEKYRDILQAMIDLTEKIDKKLIIEGIESIEQAEIISKMGCKLVQGFGISKPMHYKDIPIWIGKSYSEKDWWTKPNSIYIKMQ